MKGTELTQQRPTATPVIGVLLVQSMVEKNTFVTMGGMDM